MISNQKLYNYYLIENNDEYGTSDVSIEIKGQVKMNINLTNQQISDDAIYKNAQFIGLTLDKDINENYIIEHEEMLLKVLYINKKGRYKQIYLGSVNG